MLKSAQESSCFFNEWVKSLRGICEVRGKNSATEDAVLLRFPSNKIVLSLPRYCGCSVDAI